MPQKNPNPGSQQQPNPGANPEPRKDFPGKAPEIYAENEPGDSRDPNRGRDRNRQPRQSDPNQRGQQQPDQARKDRDPSQNSGAGGRNPNQSGNRS